MQTLFEIVEQSTTPAFIIKGATAPDHRPHCHHYQVLNAARVVLWSGVMRDSDIAVAARFNGIQIEEA